jgi:peptidoglycan/LPS O-acetylase OafA/YrhL
VGVLAALFLIGAGWTLALLRRLVGPAALLALAPAVGVAALVVCGVLLDALGAHPGGLSGALIPVVVGVAGWTVFALAGRRRPEASRTSTES